MCLALTSLNREVRIVVGQLRDGEPIQDACRRIVADSGLEPNDRAGIRLFCLVNDLDRGCVYLAFRCPVLALSETSDVPARIEWAAALIDVLQWQLDTGVNEVFEGTASAGRLQVTAVTHGAVARR
jgi:hypothetical protein